MREFSSSGRPERKRKEVEKSERRRSSRRSLQCTNRQADRQKRPWGGREGRLTTLARETILERGAFKTYF